MKQFEKRVYAHRGLNRQAPENTLAAFKKAYQVGATWIETDVDVLKDGTVIICHDSRLDRTTNRSGYYYDLTAADLARIDAGSWFSTEFTGEPLPTLRQLVRFLNQTGMNANIEIKSCEAGAELTCLLIDQVIAELSELNSNIEILVSSFNHLLLRRFKDLAPQYPVGCLFEATNLGPDWRSILELVEAEYIHPDHQMLTPKLVEDFRQAGFGVNPWTVNSPARANELFNWGCTGVFTDLADQIQVP